MSSGEFGTHRARVIRSLIAKAGRKLNGPHQAPARPKNMLYEIRNSSPASAKSSRTASPISNGISDKPPL